MVTQMNKQRVLLITGAARGIGAATAINAAKRGYSIGINYLSNHEAAKKLAEKIKAHGVDVMLFSGDVSDESVVLSLFKAVENKLGPITALVNNAGILDKQLPLREMSASRMQKIFNTNILSAFLCSREAVKRMSIKHGGSGGAIVNLSSKAACLGSPNEFIDYAASKGAIDTLTIGLAKEVADEGIRVNAVRPGLIYTDVHTSIGDPDRVKRIENGIPMKRGGQADEVAHAILWLLSDEASYTTGAFIDVTGGR